MPYPVPFAPRSADVEKANVTGAAVNKGEELRNGSIADDTVSIFPL
jgi:hypothetical protein